MSHVVAETLPLLALLGTLVVIDFPWHKRWARIAASCLRIALAVGTFFMAELADPITPSRRVALGAVDPVTTINATTLTPYGSGVLTMTREVSGRLRDTWKPLLLLCWLGAFPGIRELYRSSRAVPRSGVT